MDAGGLGNIGKYLDDLERQQRNLSTSGRNADYYRFRMYATTPPTTSVIVRGGSMWSESFGDFQVNPGGTFDMADFSNYRGQRLPFTLAYGYTYLWVSLYWDGDALTAGGSSGSTYWGWFEEFATAVEAEQAAMVPGIDQLNFNSTPSLGAFCGCLILRNDGTVPGHGILPIDQVNRGRSYIWRSRTSTATRNIN